MTWTYHPPWWMPGGDLQTIGAALWGRHRMARVRFERIRLDTPDADFVDLDIALQPQADSGAAQQQRPLLILFHGLEGSSASPYAQCFARQCQQRGWNYVVPHFRGCSGEINRAPRSYHSGDYEEIGWMLAQIRLQIGQQFGLHIGQRRMRHAPVWAVGVSLGGNALLRWAQESGEQASRQLDGVVAICSPLDLQAAGRAIDRGWNRQIYARMFLRTMRNKARQKWAQYPGLFDIERALAASTLEAFDDAFTAPLHGFDGVLDYWHRASARHGLKAIRLPALLLNAQNDPFVPAASLPTRHDISKSVELWQPATGGHVGFAQQQQRRFSLDAMPAAVCDWLAQQAGGK